VPAKEEVLKALDGSILKWKRIERSTEAEDRGSSNCPLCQLGVCFDCPIMAHVGAPGCVSTPYEAWVRHQRLAHKRKRFRYHREPHCKECLRLARLEREFLERIKTAFVLGSGVLANNA